MSEKTKQVIKDLAVDDGEAILDNFAKALMTGELKDVVIELPAIKNVAAIVKVVGSIRNYFVIRNIRSFIEVLQSDGPKKDSYAEAAKKHGQSKVLTEVLKQLDRFNAERHAAVYAYLYMALVEANITWAEFCSLGFALERFDPYSLGEHVNVDEGISNRLEGLNIQFKAAGLAYTSGPLFGGNTDHTSDLGLKFYKFGLVPFQGYLSKNQNNIA